MKVKRLLRLSLGLGLIAGSLILAAPAFAFRVSPVIVERELSQGADAHGSIVLSNTSQAAKRYRVSTKNFKALDDDGAQAFYDEGGKRDASSWIALDSAPIELTAGQEKKVEYRIHVPATVDPGGYYIALFFTELPFGNEDGVVVGVSARIGVLFLLTVNGEAVSEQAVIEDFTVLPASVMSYEPNQLDVRVRNIGLAHIRPWGTVLVKNMFGTEIAELPLNPTRGAILPQSTRRFQISWGRGPTETTNRFFSELKREWRNAMLGKYTAKVHLTYGKDEQVLVAQRTFWVVPWALISISCFFFIGLGLGSLFVYRASRKKV